MSGCELPVVINSGSGNQGITISVPIIEHAKTLNSSEEELYRALILANLLGLHQKAGLGPTRKRWNVSVYHKRGVHCGMAHRGNRVHLHRNHVC